VALDQVSDGAGLHIGGIADDSPHDLRHRYASDQVARGVPVTMIAASSAAAGTR
jgi:hypothetical protein